MVAELLMIEPAPQADSGVELLLTLLDKAGRPMQVHRAPMAALMNQDLDLTEIAHPLGDFRLGYLDPWGQCDLALRDARSDFLLCHLGGRQGQQLARCQQRHTAQVAVNGKSRPPASGNALDERAWTGCRVTAVTTSIACRIAPT